MKTIILLALGILSCSIAFAQVPPTSVNLVSPTAVKVCEANRY